MLNRPIIVVSTSNHHSSCIAFASSNHIFHKPETDMKQIPVPPTPAGTSLAGKTIIVTGGNAGLGFESARQFLVLGASRVILACRSLTKGREAVLALKADPSVAKFNPDAVIEVFELDLDDYNSGLRFSEQVKREVKELDILLNNGGMVAMSYKQSPGGHEQIMQGTYLPR